MPALRRLEERIRIRSSPQQIWDLLGDFGGVAGWASRVGTSGQTGDPSGRGVGAHRTLRHRWGFRFDEVVTAWDEGRGYSFLVVKRPFPLGKVHETWAIHRDAEDVVVSTQVEYDMRLGMIGRLIDELLVRHLILREMRQGLADLKRVIESPPIKSA